MAGKIDPRSYKVRYFCERWGKPPLQRDIGTEEEREARRVAPRVTPSKTDYGYTDTLVLVSILRNQMTGEVESIALFDTDSGNGQPSRDLLEDVSEAIDHYLEHHCP
jgi:hypothetical protein